MPQSTDIHNWTIPVPHSESDEDDNQWADILVSWIEDNLDVEVILKDTLANRPAFGTEGRWFLAKDQNPPELYLDDGASWIEITNSGDADTLDGYDSSEFGALAENETVTGSWTFNNTITGSVSGDAGTVDGFDATRLMTRQANVPLTEIPDADLAVGLQWRVPTGKTVSVWEMGVQTDANTAPTGLKVALRDMTNSVNIHLEDGVFHAEGSPLASKAGQIDVRAYVRNDTGGAVNASGYVLYTME